MPVAVCAIEADYTRFGHLETLSRRARPSFSYFFTRHLTSNVYSAGRAKKVACGLLGSPDQVDIQKDRGYTLIPKDTLPVFLLWRHPNQITKFNAL